MWIMERYLEFWLVVATGTVIACSFGIWLRHNHRTGSQFLRILLGYAAFIYPIFYLLDVYLKGSRGIGWAADWFPR